MLSSQCFPKLKALEDNGHPLPYTVRWTNGIHFGKGFKTYVDITQTFSGKMVPSELQSQEECFVNTEGKKCWGTSDFKSMSLKPFREAHRDDTTGQQD